uniref:Integrase, catalytic region, zinc finger, CCHC-type, peptidase aspartic, catalytic n=1 Tax=Tanacetum cinerariifolium TaxID=118510 RepID=A0A6L2MSE6_TANCI|nr:integrase, catalytic region, zinc finger, CCHC-type, peptidase aspartic, catalytic [Tanacetum cinerariifolium]
MDLCGPIRVKSVNRKKYILVIVDDYSRFTWVKCLRSKDEASDFIIKFLKMIQVRLNVPVCRIRTDNGTKFVNQKLCEYYEQVGISHETSVSRSPQQNSVVKRRNRTLIEAARTMLIYAQAPLFLWAEAVATACYTQNRSIVRLRHDKTPYELLHNKLPDLSFLHVFGALCYPTNDSENLGMLQQKADIGIFICYASTKKAFRIYNRRPVLYEITPTTISAGVVPKPTSSTPFVPPLRNDWDLLFQPLFDELLTPPPSVDPPAPEVITSIDEVLADGFVDPDNHNHVYKLKKDLYGLKQALHTWYDMLSSFLISQDFSKGSVDPTLFIRRNDNDLLLVQIYVDDIIFAWILPWWLDKDKEGNAIDPSHYRGMIGTLLYLTASRHDLQFAICMCARYQARPTKKHLHAVKRIFRYLCGTVNRGLWYPKDSSIALTTFADADHAGCQDTHRSTSGSLQFLGDTLISWSSKKQKSAAISSTEAEYIALSKHIDIRYHFIKEHVENGVIELYFVNTEYQLADLFTKALGRERIEI